MTDPNEATRERGSRRYTRRRLLRGGIAAGAVALGVGSAAGQEPVTAHGILPVRGEIDQELTGFFLHLGGQIDPEVSTVDDFCQNVDWTEGDILAYDARLIDRTAEPEVSEVVLYLSQQVPVRPGLLFIVNRVDQCSDNYLALELSRIGVTDIESLPSEQTPAATSTPTDSSNGFGDGFGPAAALASLLGGGWLLNRNRDRER